MQRFLLTIDRVSTVVANIFAWSILVFTLTTTYEVATRYLFRVANNWVPDTVPIFYGAFFMMGGAYALAKGAHVRGDIFYRRWPARTQAAVDLCLYAIFFFPAVLGLVSVGAQAAAQSFAIDEEPIVRTLKTIVPIAAFFLALQGVAEALRCVVALRTGAWLERPGAGGPSLSGEGA